MKPMQSGGFMTQPVLALMAIAISGQSDLATTWLKHDPWGTTLMCSEDLIFAATEQFLSHGQFTWLIRLNQRLRS